MDRIFRLLLVDDEPHVTGALSLQLEAREDLDVYIANSAAETLNVLRKTRIDLMVSDIRMPGMTGLELLSRVQKEQPDCKVILLTGYADFNYVYEAMRQGAAGYVLKNESDETLLEQIDKVPEHYRDWHHGVQDAIDADVLKRRDTLEELEADLGFAPGVLTSAVAKWNECCERGEDDFMYPMPPEWLHAIVKPPFYGCRIGGNLYGTKAGLLINDQMQVVGTNGLVIPGLYAGWHTAGGACGENSYIGDPILGSLMGDVGLAFCGGYLCGTSAVEHELQGAK